MKLIIEIHEKDYQSIKNGQIPFSVIDTIIKGTPLPERHGRLIDADDIDNHIIGHVDTRSCPTIIEADKADDEDEYNY